MCAIHKEWRSHKSMTVEYLRMLYELGKAARGEKRHFNTSKLEEDFLRFSSYCPQRSIIARVPTLYQLHGDEQRHVADACAVLGIQLAQLPEAIEDRKSTRLNSSHSS